MAIQYRQITDLPRRTTFAADDMIIVAAKNATELGYITYQTALSTLSSELINDSYSVEWSDELINSADGLDAGASDKAVAANVVYEISSSLNTVTTNYVNKNATTKQTIVGPLSCKTTPEFTTCKITDGNNKAVNVELLKSYVSTAIPSSPLFTTMFSKVDLDKRNFILSDVLPLVAKSDSAQKFTLIVKMKSSDNSTTARKTTFTFNNNGSNVDPTTMSGTSTLKYTKASGSGTKAKPAVDNTWWHAKVQFTLAAKVEPAQVNWVIDNVNAAVNVSMSIFSGHV